MSDTTKVGQGEEGSVVRATDAEREAPAPKNDSGAANHNTFFEFRNINKGFCTMSALW